MIELKTEGIPDAMKSASKAAIAALGYAQNGFSVIPARADKRPIGAWGKYQKAIPTEQEIRQGFPDGCNIAVIGGAVSGNLGILDFDMQGEKFKPFMDDVKRERSELYERLVYEKSPSKGDHIPVRVNGDVGRNVKLAEIPFFFDKPGTYELYGKSYQTDEKRKHKGKYLITVDAIETRCNGGYCLISPSKGYEFVKGSLLELPTITQEEWDFLLNTARLFNEWVEPSRMVQPLHSTHHTEGVRPGDAFNEKSTASDIAGILINHGWQNAGTVGDNIRLRRPGKKTGWSATVSKKQCVFYPFTCSTPFEPNRGYSAFRTYAVLEHNGDFRAASKQLFSEGYGELPQKPINHRDDVPPMEYPPEHIGNSIQESEPPKDEKWIKAKDLFPKTPFPWKVFPASIAESLKQLARACATSPTALPGAAMSVFSSVLGSTISVSPKRSWNEPLVLWFMDIRNSGDGKTPAARQLCKPLYSAQRKADEIYEAAMEDWRSKPKKERGSEPKRARGYFITDLTLEGLRDDISGHGGTVCIMDELSSFVNGQNQYKSKGNDRESWLQIHDGNPFRVVRSSKSKMVTGARVNLFGGIQPAIFRNVFSGEKGVFLQDGTVFRFLATYEGEQFHPLTAESWSSENQGIWEKALANAMAWADYRISAEDWKTLNLKLGPEAREHFFDWANELKGQKSTLPALVNGFIPKSIGYALRLSGILHCLDRFSKNGIPDDELSLVDVQLGITAATFYLGHLVNAMEMLLDEKHSPTVEVTDQTVHLVDTLEQLKPELDGGKLAVGFIQERFDATCKPELKTENQKTMGALLASLGLTKSRKTNANGRRGVFCLIWDEKTETLIENVRNVRNVRQPSNDEPLEVADIENQRPQRPPEQKQKGGYGGYEPECLEEIKKPDTANDEVRI